MYKNDLEVSRGNALLAWADSIRSDPEYFRIKLATRVQYAQDLRNLALFIIDEARKKVNTEVDKTEVAVYNKPLDVELFEEVVDTSIDDELEIELEKLL